MLGWSTEARTFCFALEPRHALSIAAKGVGKNLDGYISPKFWIAGTVDFAHPTSPEGPKNVIVIENLAWAQKHLRDYICSNYSSPINRNRTGADSQTCLPLKNWPQRALCCLVKIN